MIGLRGLCLSFIVALILSLFWVSILYSKLMSNSLRDSNVYRPLKADFKIDIDPDPPPPPTPIESGGIYLWSFPITWTPLSQEKDIPPISGIGYQWQLQKNTPFPELSRQSKKKKKKKS